MTVTANLLKLFRVDQQLRGLQTRLQAADRFHQEQLRLLRELEGKHGTLSKQLVTLKASVASQENEAATVDTRMAALREQMNQARTNKEYSAFLAELNTLKAQKDGIEKGELEQMEKVEALEKQVGELAVQAKERTLIVDRAKSDRDAKESEIAGRLAELRGQREAVAKEIPPTSLKEYQELLDRRGDDAMSHVEVLDRRNHEWTCGSCMMALPMETINSLSRGHLTRCAACRCFLYTEEDVVSKKKQAVDA